MLKVEYTQTNYAEVLHQLANQLNVPVSENRIVLPAHVGEGTVEYYELPQGIEVLISDYSLVKDIVLQRSRISFEQFALRFDMMQTPDRQQKSGVFLNNTCYDWIFMANAGSKIKSINIKLEKQLLSTIFSSDAEWTELEKYLSFKNNSSYFEALDAEYRSLILYIYHTGSHIELKSFTLYNRILLLIEKFFSRMYRRITDEHFHVKLTNYEINRIKKVESLLLSDFSSIPPSINILAKQAAMSVSKLKSVFKEMYGLPVYKYFQKHRMQKAKAMLLSKNYSLKTVSAEVGYANTANFVKAFRKVFEQSPEELIQ